MKTASLARPLAPRPAMPELDPMLVASACSLLLLGLVMVYSASIATAEGSSATAHHPAYFLIRHTAFLAVGVALGLIVFQIPLRLLQRLSFWLFFACLLLLVIVLIPGIGRAAGGAQRWISLGPVSLQPSEFMKLAAVLYAADYTTRKLSVMKSVVQGFIPMAIVMIITAALLLREPDFGAFVVIVAIALGILFLGGLNGRLFVLLLAALAIAFAALILTSPYRWERIISYMDPWRDPFGKGYQLSHALIAFGRGEWLGVGLGASVEKLFYLPEAHTDFLLAVIAEELGFVGVAIVIGLFSLLVWRAFAIGQKALLLDRIYAGLVAQGIGLWIGLQSFINMGVNMGLLPTKGLTLPLMSFGGSSLVACCLALGILARVDWENRRLMRGLSA
ncbi:MAG: putative lipid II flippase FtsW [Rhodocyclaceae bacterium]|nr:putative lipid II flippase FtsW [Rhodocyclaceae bacterium]